MAHLSFNLVQGLSLHPIRRKQGWNLDEGQNTFIIFMVSGFWHGANWTFIVWGALNALYFLPLLLLKKNRVNTDTVAQGKWFPSIKEMSQMILTFLLTVIAWIFFRAENLEHAIQYLNQMFSLSLFDIPRFAGMKMALVSLILVFIFIVIEWYGRESQFAIQKIKDYNSCWLRWTLYSALLFLIGISAQTGETPFIYFQF